jgi:hypothetical protein
MLECGRRQAREKAGLVRSIRAQPLTGTHEKVRQHRIVLRDFEREFAQVVAGRFGPDGARWGHSGRNAGRAGRDGERDER